MVAAGITVLLWASAFVVIRHVGAEVSPGALSLGRLLVASLLLGAVVFARPRRWPGRRDWRSWRGLIVCGLLWFGVYNLALNEAEQRIDAGTAAMLVNLGPILIAFLAGVFLGEGFPRSLAAGISISFAGVVLIGTASSTGGADAWGVVLCLVAAGAYAIGVVAQKPLLGHLTALQVTWMACTIGLVGCLPFAPDLVRELGDARLSTAAWVVFLGAFPTALAFTTWAFALAHTSAGKMGATTYLVPPVTIGMSWGFLGETPAVLAIGGGALCLVGVFVVRRGGGVRRRRARRSAGSSGRPGPQ
ncbi:MAG: EamA family transporter [Propionibacteriales bacterium]|nr:EamA family transporter [Propionibacteriales bacterium]